MTPITISINAEWTLESANYWWMYLICFDISMGIKERDNSCRKTVIIKLLALHGDFLTHE
ncbi:hypothetical protein TW73_17725 [Pseudoalteromonas piscicida]|nr:hypothetical protein TW73_17725 [Pseudoalteromonas piscicida]